jgi:hypothetical protein
MGVSSVQLMKMTDAVSVNRWANLNHDFGKEMTCVGGGASYPYLSGEVMFVVNTTSAALATVPTGPTAPATVTVTALASSNSGSSSQGSDMVSTSVPIGVGVGIGVALGTAAIALGILYRRERRLRKTVERNLAEKRDGCDHRGNGTQQKSGIYQPRPVELYSARNPQELYSEGYPHELG